MPFNPVGQQYKPDALASGGATQRQFQEQGSPKGSGGIVTTLMRLAMRRMPAHGFGATQNTRSIAKGDAMSMGSHGQIK